MPNLAELDFTEVDNSRQVTGASSNISAILYDAEMGPVNDPSDIITTETEFLSIYGGIKKDGSNKEAFNCVMRALNNGTSLRVVNIKHYTDIDNAQTATPTLATIAPTLTYQLSADLAAGASLRIHAGTGTAFITKMFPFIGSSANTIDVMLAWLRNTWELSTYLNGPVIYTNRLDTKTFIIITQDGSAPLAIDVVASDNSATPITPGNSTNEVVNAAGEPLFSIAPKYPGARYNDLFVQVIKQDTYSQKFTLVIGLLNSPIEPEVYTNLYIPTMTDTSYLDEVVSKSKLGVPVYANTSSNTHAPIIRDNIAFRFTGGTDGGAITEVDIIGSGASHLGFSSLDGFDDISRVANFVFLQNLDDVHRAGAAYATQRADIIYFFTLQGTRTQVINQRNNLAINTSYARCYTAGDGIYILDKTSKVVNASLLIPPIGDVIGIAANSAEKYGPWMSYANSNRGALTNVKKLGNNWGNTTGVGDMKLLAQSQINMIITQDKTTMVWGNFTMQVGDTLLSYASIRDLIIYIKKSLRAPLRAFLEEPNDIPTWILIYNTVFPFFHGLETKRAIYPKEQKGWDWKGDQNAATMRDLVVNNFADVQAGKYKVILELRPINSLQTFSVQITLDASDLSVGINSN